MRLSRSFFGKDGSRKSVHPWIFQSSIKSVDGSPAPGDVVAVHDSADAFVGYAHYSPSSSIRARILSIDKEQYPDTEWLKKILQRSFRLRTSLSAEILNSDSCRMVFGESDGLPGLVIDKYSKYLVAQFLTAGMERLKNTIAEFALEVSGTEAIIERSDCEIRKHEGISDSTTLSLGKTSGIPDPLVIAENNFKFNVSLAEGQKTGFYLDQRMNRRITASFIRPGMRVLDCFSYTGAFSINAAAAGAEHITLVDESQSALDTAESNFKLNGFSEVKREYHADSVFKVLRGFRDRNLHFDFIILDPPKLAPTKASVDRASRAYKDVNLLAMKLVAPGGFIATFSCSSGIGREKFREILCWASEDSGRKFQINQSFSQPADHPIALDFPESEYLKGFLIREGK